VNARSLYNSRVSSRRKFLLASASAAGALTAQELRSPSEPQQPYRTGDSTGDGNPGK